ncbi:MAG: ABC transporter permease [Bacteroidota bacterium]
MIQYITKKIFYGIVVLFGVITVIFFLFNVLPGDPAIVMLGQRANKEAVDAIHKDLGTDRPIMEQYGMYLNDLSPISIHNYKNDKSLWYLNHTKYSWKPLFTIGKNKSVVLKFPHLRRSYISKRPVSDIIIETLPETAVLAFSSILIASIIGIFLGILSAVKQNTFYDRLSLVFAVLGMAAPSFFVGLIIAWLFGYVLRDYTGLSPTGSLFDIDVWEGSQLKLKNLVLPAITLGIRPLAIVVQLMRSSLLDVMSQDYIKTAKAKGLTLRSVIIKHALKNALNPVVTAISGWFAGLMAGAIFVEKIFSWKGIGYEVFEALTKNDLPVVMGATIIFATIFVITNIVVDIVYGLLDPRVRLK